jgi:hypothetical protein
MAGQRVYMFNPNDEQWSFAPCAADAADDQRGLVHMLNFGHTSSAADEDGDATLSGDEDKPVVDPLKVIHGALRGRYPLAIAIAVAGSTSRPTTASA